MLRHFVAYAVVLVAFLAIDFVWLGYVAREFYKSQMGDLLAPQPLLTPAAAFYLLYAAGLVFFAVAPGLREQSWRVALLNGAALGLIAYATYDLTNLAVVRGWPAMLSVVDLAWGACLSAAAAAIGYFAAASLPAA